MQILKSSVVAVLATLFCIWLLRPLSVRLGFVDRPGGRKRHEYNTPLVGGVAMFFGFCFALLDLHQSLQSYRGLIAGSSLLILMGVVDDFKELSSQLRLVGQFFSAFFLVSWGQHSLTNLGNLVFYGDLHIALLRFPLTLLVVVGFINAMNMMDGQDGLAGGIALTQTSLLLFLALQLHRYQDVSLLIIIAAVLLVFLAFNMRFPWRKKASIFMGDSGATFIAFLIAWFAIELSQANVRRVQPMTVLWILSLPLFDLISVSMYRIQQKKSVFLAGRDHVHHVLHLAGMNVSFSTFLLCLLSFLLGVLGIEMNALNIHEGWQFVWFNIALIGYLTLVQCVRRNSVDPPERAELLSRTD